MVNEIPSYRVDNMPYGGEELGLGREGIRFDGGHDRDQEHGDPAEPTDRAVVAKSRCLPTVILPASAPRSTTRRGSARRCSISPTSHPPPADRQSTVFGQGDEGRPQPPPPACEHQRQLCARRQRLCWPGAFGVGENWLRCSPSARTASPGGGGGRRARPPGGRARGHGSDIERFLVFAIQRVTPFHALARLAPRRGRARSADRARRGVECGRRHAMATEEFSICAQHFLPQ